MKIIEIFELLSCNKGHIQFYRERRVESLHFDDDLDLKDNFSNNFKMASLTANASKARRNMQFDIFTWKKKQ